MVAAVTAQGGAGCCRGYNKKELDRHKSHRFL
jgi:hypothetical protein